MQAVLRQWFGQWGLPDALRLDNGPPWGSGHDLPPELALWLRGLGIALVWNRPRHRQGNAVIERAHGVCQRWVEPATCHSAAELPARVDAFTRLQRERYPSGEGRSRLAAYPALAQPRRAYDPRHEAAAWEARRVWAFLATPHWQRRVDKVGQVSLSNRAVSVGRRWAGTMVTGQLAVRTGRPTWLIRAADGTLRAAPPAPELPRGRIRALAVSQRRPRPPKGGKLHVPQESKPYSR